MMARCDRGGLDPDQGGRARVPPARLASPAAALLPLLRAVLAAAFWPARLRDKFDRRLKR